MPRKFTSLFNDIKEGTPLSKKGEYRCDCYLAILKKKREEFPDAHFEVITRRAGHILSPSWKLLNRLKDFEGDNPELFWDNLTVEERENEKWTWYTREFLKELRANFAQVHEELERLREIVKERDVYLVCVEANRNVEENHHCHRFIIKEILEHKIVL